MSGEAAAPVSLTIDGDIATIKVDRPSVLNALDSAAWELLGALVAQIRDDDSVRCVVVTGAGERAFVAGSDVRELHQRSIEQTFAARTQAVLDAVDALEVPTIAALNGHALGGGCELALACDVRFAVPDAKIGLPEVTLGIIPGAGGTWRLMEIVGVAKAKEMILGGLIVDMREAFRMGLVNRLVARDELLDETYSYARRICDAAPLAVKSAKLLLNSNRHVSTQAAVAERFAQSYLFTTEDRVSGTQAAIEKTSPHYRGH